MTNSIIKFEALLTNEETVLKNINIKDECCIDYYPNSDYKYTPPLCRNKSTAVYSEMLDEYLNYKDVKILKDDVSILYIFKLDDSMYTMASIHNIGLKNFNNAVLVVEYFLVPQKHSNP